jgi:3-deoxy-D-manno-octulosonate 8-phosphate phosphatase (KDO 8-P phosphatase)
VSNFKIKLFITDIDGVWTDAGMYYDNINNELKKFNTKDAIGVFFLKLLGIETVIISSENTNIVKRRAKKLAINKCFLGVENKLDFTLDLCKKQGIDIKEVAFIGDEINDLNLIENVGLSACPSNAASYIKREVNWIMTKKGGDGVYREFVIKYLNHTKKMEEVIQKSKEFYSSENIKVR